MVVCWGERVSVSSSRFFLFSCPDPVVLVFEDGYIAVECGNVFRDVDHAVFEVSGDSFFQGLAFCVIVVSQFSH